MIDLWLINPDEVLKLAVLLLDVVPWAGNDEENRVAVAPSAPNGLASGGSFASSCREDSDDDGLHGRAGRDGRHAVGERAARDGDGSLICVISSGGGGHDGPGAVGEGASVVHLHLHLRVWVSGSLIMIASVGVNLAF